MAWRMAKSLDTLLAQINAMAPNRSKLSDGGIGDAAHASRSSDHNPWVKDGRMGVVTARDFTHDPTRFDAHWLADTLKANKDPRIKYVISRAKIWNPSISPDWRPYRGVNAHAHHTHISVKPEKRFYDDNTPWNLTTATQSPADSQRTEAGKEQTVNIKPVQAPSKRFLEVSAPDAMKLFQDLGWAKHQAAALVAQGMWESGGHGTNVIRTTALGDGGTAHGGWQWRGDRYIGPRGLLGYAMNHMPGRSSAEGEVQIHFVNWELNNTEKRAGNLLKQAKTVQEASEAVIGYLRPAGYTRDNPRGGHAFAKRLALAEKLMS